MFNITKITNLKINKSPKYLGREGASNCYLPNHLLCIIESSHFQKLSQQFQWWLGSIFFWCWHVQVINEHNHL